jgi:hypothetical protein
MSRLKKNNIKTSVYIDKEILANFHNECDNDGVEYSDVISIMMRWYCKRVKELRGNHEIDSTAPDSQ